jgi:cytoskeleton protein RodZ
VSDATPGPGAIVRAQRESRGLTQQDIADTLNLGVRVIGDMETENWSRLPGPAFTRGYLRAYAKLLDIDPDVVASAFDAAVSRGEARSAEVTSVQFSQRRGLADLSQKHPGVVLTSAVAVVACAVAIVLWAVWPQVEAGESVVSAKQPAGPAEVVLPKKAQPTATTEPPATEPAPSDAQPAPATVSGATPVAAAATPSVDPRHVPHDDRGAHRITSDGNDRLNFAFTDDCWVEIKDAKGGSVYSDLSKSGDALELIGRPPFHILLGNAPAVTLAFNGERVALSPHTRNNVGTLVLGQ